MFAVSECLPTYDDRTNIDDFRFYLAKANSLCKSPLSGIIGDFNANIILDTHRLKLS